MRRIERDSDDIDLQELSRSDYRKDVLATVLYGSLALACAVEAVSSSATAGARPRAGAAPAVASLLLGRNFVKEARLEHGRTELERRAQEVLVQDELAPRRWAERLAPDDLPQIEGFELGPGLPGRVRAHGRRLLRRVCASRKTRHRRRHR